MSGDDVKAQRADDVQARNEAAGAAVVQFRFAVPDVPVPEGRKLHMKLAGTSNLRASMQILNGGGENNLHYHPNMDLIYMVLKGCVEFFGPGDKPLGKLNVNEGIMLPEYARYWFRSVGDEEAHLLQMAGYPKGPEASTRVPVEPPKATSGSVWVGMTDEELAVRARNIRH